MTMDVLEGEAKGLKDYNLERLIMLSDGVFAIAMTLLALEIRPPEHWDRTIAGLVHGMGRELLAYGLSFLVIAVYWASHRRTFQRFRRSDTGLTVCNFLVLGLVTLLPFASRLIAEGGPRGEPFAVYIGLITAIGVANALMWGYAAFIGQLVDPAVPNRLRLVLLLVLLIVPTGMATAGIFAADNARWWVSLILLSFALPILWLRQRLQKQAGL